MSLRLVPVIMSQQTAVQARTVTRPRPSVSVASEASEDSEASEASEVTSATAVRAVRRRWRWGRE